jgi:thioredoxin-related protein
MTRFIYPRLLACCAACWCTALAIGEAPTSEIQWRWDYTKARQEAVEKGRLLVIDIGTENCYYCKQLDLRTFRDPAVATLLNDRCVPLKIDANQHAKLAADLHVDTYPTLVFASPEGRILGSQVGFIEAPGLQDLVRRALSVAGAAPEGMARDFEDAGKAVAKSDYARAVVLLQNVLEDGKDRPVQVQARKMLQEIEDQAAERCAKAKELIDAGKLADAVEALAETLRLYAGTKAAKDGTQAILTLASRGVGGSPRAQASRALLNQAREDYDHKEYLRCLDRCEALTASYADLPAAAEAAKLASQIKTTTDVTHQVCEQMGDRMSIFYLDLAEAWLKKGQPQQAVFYLERLVLTFPNSRHAELAQARLAQIQGASIRFIEAARKPD